MKREGVCIVGYGETAFVRPKDGDRSTLQHMAEAIELALDNAGVGWKDVQQLCMTTYNHDEDYPSIAEQLRLELERIDAVDFGGASGVISVRRAADAIQLGQIDVAVCVGGDTFRRLPERTAISYQQRNHIEPYQFGGPNSLFALAERRHMAQYGTTLEQLGKLAVAQRKNAGLNENALLRQPMTVDDYLNARLISDPIRLLDCVILGGGADAVVVASERKAKELTPNPIYILSDVERHNYRVNEMLLDRTVNGFEAIRDELFSTIKQKDIDILELYDDYPIAVIMQFEDLGFCEKGKGGEFVENHDLTIYGDLPVNTGGGQLSGGQAGMGGGYKTLVEAVRQLKREAGRHQVAGARTALVTGLGLLGYNVNINCCSGMILQRR